MEATRGNGYAPARASLVMMMTTRLRTSSNQFLVGSEDPARSRNKESTRSDLYMSSYRTDSNELALYVVQLNSNGVLFKT